MNGHKGLGMKFIIALVVYAIGAILGVMGGVASMPEMQP